MSSLKVLAVFDDRSERILLSYKRVTSFILKSRQVLSCLLTWTFA